VATSQSWSPHFIMGHSSGLRMKGRADQPERLGEYTVGAKGEVVLGPAQRELCGKVGDDGVI
jgi:hypothetical protein